MGDAGKLKMSSTDFHEIVYVDRLWHDVEEEVKWIKDR